MVTFADEIVESDLIRYQQVTARIYHPPVTVPAATFVDNFINHVVGVIHRVNDLVAAWCSRTWLSRDPATLRRCDGRCRSGSSEHSLDGRTRSTARTGTAGCSSSPGKAASKRPGHGIR